MEGVGDMSCVLEARLKGLQLIAITNRADIMELAIKGAIDKIENAPKSMLGRIKNY
ncbi:MAG: hypothetical protein ACI86M_000643 [Saprospiraceae bacterium]|jgi:hypothetical protein